MPGVEQRSAALRVAEWGIDRGRCGTAARLSAWSGVAPGTEERAGQQRSGKPRQGTRALRTGVTHLAPAAARPQDTSRVAWGRAARRGKNRALRAVAHAIVVRAFPRRSRNAPSQELGANGLR